MAHLQRGQVTRLVVDFADVQISGSVMLTAIVRIARQLRKGNVAFCGASPDMQSVLEHMRFTKLWPYFDSRAEAIESFAPSANL